MYFFHKPKSEKPPSMSDFSRPSNSVLLNNNNQLDIPIMDRPSPSQVSKLPDINDDSIHFS